MVDVILETPYSLKNEKNRDIFEEIISDQEYDYVNKRLYLWSEFAYLGIGNCNVDYFVSVLKGKYTRIKDEYDLKIKTFEKLTSLKNIDLSDDQLESTTEYTNEDMPETPIEDEVYISSKNKQTYNSKRQSGLMSETVRNFIDAIENPYNDFVDEFEQYFVVLM